jgi:hypothetical protein
MTEVPYEPIGIIRPEHVAEKLQAIRNYEYPEILDEITAQPRLEEMLWFLQYVSMQPGGLRKFCERMIEEMSARFGTPSMRAADSLPLSFDSRLRIYVEIPRAFQYYVSDLSREVNELVALMVQEEPPGTRTTAEDRATVSKHTKSWTKERFREVCFKAACEQLPRYLEALCTEKAKGFKPRTILEVYDLSDLMATEGQTETWFIDDPIGAVFEMMDRQASGVSRRLAMTAVSKKVFDALDYALQERTMVRIEGDSRFGKTESIRAWADMRPGLARVVNVPSSNLLADLVRNVAQALGIAARYWDRAHVLRGRVEYVLQQSGLFLILDEAAFLIPQNYTETTPPARLNWVRTEIVDRGLPLAIVVTPQTFMPAVGKFAKKTGFAMQQFLGRNYRVVQLPSELDQADLTAVARIHFPEMGEDYLALIADLAGMSENYLQTAEAVAKLARYIARRAGHRRITVSDIEAAVSEVIPRRQEPASAPAVTGRAIGTRRRLSGTSDTPIKEPLTAPAKTMQPGRMRRVEVGVPHPASLPAGRVETDLVPA